MRGRLIAGLALALIPAAASAASLLSYTIPAAVIEVDSRKFRVSVHPKQDLIMVQSTMGAAFNGPANHPQNWPVQTWRDVAELVVEPLGCGIPEVRVLSKMGGVWEAAYLCPEGVDLRAIYKEQRKALDAGEPLRRP